MADPTLYRQLIASDPNVHPIKIHWSIKGYHAFHRRPYQREEMILKVVPEDNNQYDAMAMLVIAPFLHEIPERLHNEITHPGDHRHPPQRVRNIAGRSFNISIAYHINI